MAIQKNDDSAYCETTKCEPYALIAFLKNPNKRAPHRQFFESAPNKFYNSPYGGTSQIVMGIFSNFG